MYDRQKEDEVILYLAQRLEPAYPQKVLDVLYLAEKLHLSKYGRTVTGDKWVGYRTGPRPRRFWGILPFPELKGVYELGDFQGTRTVSPYMALQVVRPLREHDRMHFSESDEECLDAAIRMNHEQGDAETYNRARDFAWNEATYFVTDGGFSSMPLLGIALSLPNALEVVRLLYVEGQLPQVW